MLIDFRESRRERGWEGGGEGEGEAETERETSIRCLLFTPQLGIKPVTEVHTRNPFGVQDNVPTETPGQGYTSYRRLLKTCVYFTELLVTLRSY